MSGTKAADLMRRVIEVMIKRAVSEYRATGKSAAEAKAFKDGFCAGMCANPLQAPEDVWDEAMRKVKR